MNSFLERLSLWNLRMNGLPRKGLLIAVTLVLTAVFLMLAPLCWPFLLAMLFSMMLEPPVRFCVARVRRVRLSRGPVTLILMALLFGVLGVVLFALVSRLFHELISLARSAPVFVDWLSATAVPYVRGLYQQYSDVLPVTVMNAINSGLSSLGESAVKTAASLSAALTGGAVNAAAAIPGILLSVVLTIMGTYYMTADRERILAFFRRTFPADLRKHSLLLKNNLFRSLFGQVKSQMLVSLIIISFLMLSFAVYGVRYGLLFGFLIGLADALPVVGAGLFLIPWSLVELVTGNYASAAFFAAVYVGTVVIRQISEPRIVGANLGLYPLATMVAMFAGFRLMGFLGLLAGPILLNLLKVVLEADDVARGVKKEPPRPRPRGRKRQGTADGTAGDAAGKPAPTQVSSVPEASVDGMNGEEAPREPTDP